MANEYLDKLKDENGDSHPLHDSRISDDNITSWSNKQSKLVFDMTPTTGSTNPVTSDGIKTYVDSHKIILTAGQTVTYTWDELTEFVKQRRLYCIVPGSENQVFTCAATAIHSSTDIGDFIAFSITDSSTAEDNYVMLYEPILKKNDLTWIATFLSIPTKEAVSAKQDALQSGLDLKIENNVIQVDAKLKSGTTLGSLAFAEGDQVEASGNSSHAEGGTTAATAECSHAEGCQTKATNKQTHSEGYKTLASGECAHAEGNDTVASGKQSHAEGFDGVASGECSHTEGAKTQALGTSSHAEGGVSSAYGKDSHAEGFNSTTREYKLKDGGSEMTASDWEPLDANTTQTDTSQNFAQHAEGYETIAGGVASHAEGQATKAYGRNSHAEGLATEAFGEECHTEGVSTQAGGKYCHAEGAATIVQGTASHTEGSGGGVTPNGTTVPNTRAYGEACHSEGRATYAAGTACHAEGDYVEYKKSDGTYAVLSNDSTGYGTHAEGVGTYAASNGAHAEGSADTGSYGVLAGQRVTAAAQGSHAEGIGTQSTAPGSHAEGIDSIASSPAAHAEGFYTLATSPNQHVVGKYNVNDSTATYAEIVGGGTSDTARKNIRTLDWNGNEYIAGSSTAKTVIASDSMVVGGTTFNSTNIIKWNKNSGQDTSDFELAGFILATHKSTTNTATYYPPNESQEDLGNPSNAQLFTLASTRCGKMNIQCEATMAISFSKFYATNMIGKTFEIVLSNSSTSGDITVHLSNNYGESDADNIRFINGVDSSTGAPSGVYDGTLSLTVSKGTCREIKFTILPSFTDNSKTYTFVCLWGLLNLMTAGDSTHPVYFNKGIPKIITAQIALSNTFEQCFVAKHSTSGKSIALGVGSAGNNRGIYDNSESKWLVYKDANNAVHLGTATTGASSKPVYMNAGVPTACSSIATSLIAQINKTPTTPYNSTDASSASLSTTQTTYDINFSNGTNWVGFRSTKSASGNGIVGGNLTNGSTKTAYNFLQTLHLNRTGNTGVLYGYFIPRPAADTYYFMKSASTTKLSMRPKDCVSCVITGLTETNGAVGGTQCLYTADKNIHVFVAGDGSIHFDSATTFESFANGAAYFFCVPLAYTSFTN